jgi:5-methylcytosine-specific restriction enzyme A
MKRRRVAMITPGRPAVDTGRYRAAEKTADPIFGTQAYRIWREAVVDRAHNRCQWLCDGIPCGRSEPRMFADHIIERSDGGEPFDVDNGQCLCGQHHTIKTNIEKRKRKQQLEQFMSGAINE